MALKVLKKVKEMIAKGLRIIFESPQINIKILFIFAMKFKCNFQHKKLKNRYINLNIHTLNGIFDLTGNINSHQPTLMPSINNYKLLTFQCINL